MLVFLHSPVIQNFRQRVQGTKYPSIWPELCVEALFILGILTLGWKMKGYKGSVLHHGPISGRVAFGFFCMTLIVVNPSVEVRLASAAFMVLIIVQGASVPSRPYSVRQVVLGAILGILVPGLVFAAHFAVPGSGAVSVRILHTLHDAYPGARDSALKRNVSPPPKEVTNHLAP